jgi:hypothetical protein
MHHVCELWCYTCIFIICAVSAIVKKYVSDWAISSLQSIRLCEDELSTVVGVPVSAFNIV